MVSSWLLVPPECLLHRYDYRETDCRRASYLYSVGAAQGRCRGLLLIQAGVRGSSTELVRVDGYFHTHVADIDIYYPACIRHDFSHETHTFNPHFVEATRARKGNVKVYHPRVRMQQEQIASTFYAQAVINTTLNLVIFRHTSAVSW